MRPLWKMEGCDWLARFAESYSGLRPGTDRMRCGICMVPLRDWRETGVEGTRHYFASSFDFSRASEDSTSEAGDKRLQMNYKAWLRNFTLSINAAAC